MAEGERKGWFSMILSRADAAKVVKDTSMAFFVVAAIQAGLSFLIGFSVLFDVVVYTVGGFFLRRLYSRAAAIILLLVAGGAAVGTFANKLGANLGGGTNIILALIVLWAAVRAVEATFKLHGQFATSAGSDNATYVHAERDHPTAPLLGTLDALPSGSRLARMLGRPRKEGKGSMSRREMLFITLPFIILLMSIAVYEIKTSYIPDEVVVPAAIYFLIVSSVFGSKSWWNYLLGTCCMLFLFLLLALLLEGMFGAPVIGGGAIKLMAVIGATLGIKLALEVGVTFIISLCILAAVSVFIFYIGRVPSSPFILSSIFLVYVWNYGSRFLVPSE